MHPDKPAHAMVRAGLELLGLRLAVEDEVNGPFLWPVSPAHPGRKNWYFFRTIEVLLLGPYFAVGFYCGNVWKRDLLGPTFPSGPLQSHATTCLLRLCGTRSLIHTAPSMSSPHPYALLQRASNSHTLQVSTTCHPRRASKFCMIAAFMLSQG